MRFEYHSFDVRPFLVNQRQPSFVLSGLKPGSRYCTLTDPDTGKFSVTSGSGNAVRIPVFGISTAVSSDDLLDKLSPGSLLASIGLEVAIKFMLALQIGGRDSNNKVERVVIVIATDTHALAGDKPRYRVYFGMTLETVS
jgi:hypothetical protein